VPRVEANKYNISFQLAVDEEPFKETSRRARITERDAVAVLRAVLSGVKYYLDDLRDLVYVVVPMTLTLFFFA
jgi:hypothetical protein